MDKENRLKDIMKPYDLLMAYVEKKGDMELAMIFSRLMQVLVVLMDMIKDGNKESN